MDYRMNLVESALGKLTEGREADRLKKNIQALDRIAAKMLSSSSPAIESYMEALNDSLEDILHGQLAVMRG